MSHNFSPDRLAEVSLSRRAEKALLRQAKGYWVGTRQGLKRAVRRYVRRYRSQEGLLSGLLRSTSRAAAAALLALQLYAMPVGADHGPDFAFGEPQANPFGLTYQGDSRSAPAFVDLDGDSDLDVVSGGYYGDFRYFKNMMVESSSSGPSFVEQTGTLNPLDGLNVVGWSTPAFADLDGDGDLDMLSGEIYGGFVYFDNTGSSTSPAFSTVSQYNPFGLSGTNDSRSAPAFGDLDGDGDLDLLAGAQSGFFYYFENTVGGGLTPALPAFGPAQSNPFGLQDVGAYSRPAFADLDGDGDLDMLSGEYYGGFIPFENTGSSSSPAFFMHTGESDNPFAGMDVGYASTPTFGDLDGDGDLDLLSGEYYGSFVYFEQIPAVSSIPPVVTLSEQDPLTFVENAEPLTLDTNLTVSDTDDDSLSAAQVWFSQGYQQGADYLWVDAEGLPIGQGFDWVNGVLYLWGQASVADYQAALRSVVYQNVSEDPTPDTRIISYLVDDGHDGGDNGDLQPSTRPLALSSSKPANAPASVPLALPAQAPIVQASSEEVSLSVGVIPVNDNPYFYIWPGGISVPPGGTSGPQALFLYDADHDSTELRIAASSDDESLILSDNIEITGSSFVRLLRITSHDDESQGDLSVTLRLYDTGLDGEPGTPDDSSHTIVIPVHVGGETVFGAYVDVAEVFTEPGMSQPDLYLRLINSTGAPVGGLQFDLDLSQVFYAQLGIEGDEEIFSHIGVEDIIDGSIAPAGYQVAANLIDGGNTLKVAVFTLGDYTIPSSNQAVLLARLRYTAGQVLGVEDPIGIIEGSVLVSDPFGNDLFFGSQGGAIQVGIACDVTKDGAIDIRDVVVLVAGLVGRPGFMVPSDPQRVDFKIQDCNTSGFIDVGDAISIINEILGIDEEELFSKAVSGPAMVSLGAAVILEGGQAAIPVLLEGSVAGVQASFTFDPSLMSVGTPVFVGDGSGLLLDSQVRGGELKVVVVSLTAGGLPVSSQGLIYIPVSLKGEEEGVLRLSQVTLADRAARSVEVVLSGELSQAVSRELSLPKAFALSANRPNPFNPATEIGYEVPAQAHVMLTVYNLLGQEVVRLVDGVKQAGRYSVRWDGRNGQGQTVSSGVYLYRMTSSTGFSETKRMTLLK